MKYILDTCVISELIKPKPDLAVVQWVNAQYETDIYLSVLTLGEIQKGVSKLLDSKKKQALQHWIDHQLSPRFESRILDVSTEVAKKWGEVQGNAERQGKKMAAIDSLIATTGLVHNAIIVTRNIDDMVQSGATLFNPWD